MKIFYCLFISLVIVLSGYSQDITLEEPLKKANMDLLDAIQNRTSYRNFVKKEISNKNLSTLLWAGNGVKKNFDVKTSASKSNRTIAFAFDVTYINIYVFMDKGVFLYDPDKNILKQISNKNYKNKIAVSNSESAYGTFLFTVNPSKLPAFIKSDKNAVINMAQSSAGYAAQNIALTGTALKIGAIPMFSMNQNTVQEALKLDKDEFPLMILQFGSIE